MSAIFIITLIVFQLLLVFVHLTVYATASAAFGIGGLWMEIIFIVLALTFTTASLLAHYSKNTMVQWYYAFSAYWFGLVHFLFIGAVAFFIAENIFNAYATYVNPALIGGICFGALFVIHLYGTWNSGRAEIVRIKMPLPSVPEYWKQHPLVFVSDVHLGAIRGEAFARNVVNKINAEAPAVVIIGGDLYDGVKCDAEKIIEPLKSLNAPRGIYYITGNHEYYGEFERYMAAIRGAGVRILNNEVVDIEGIRFAGVSYQEVHKREDFQNVLRALAISSAILIKHEPDNLDLAEQAGFSGGFFGHTHQGQIWPLSYITARMYGGFDYGLKQFKKMWVYTSSGVGTWGPPLRLGTKSEIVVVSFV